MSTLCVATPKATAQKHTHMGRPNSSRTEGEAACKQTAQVWSHLVTCQEHCNVCLSVCIHIHIIYTKRFAVQQRQRQEGAQITETLKFGTGSSISLECSAKIMARKTHYSNMGRPHSSRTEGEAACKQTAQVWSHRVTCQEHCNVCLSVCLSVCMYVCTCIRYVPRDLQ